MSQSESDEVAKGDFSRLLLLVDIANIRPRSIKNKKRFQANFGMKLPLFGKAKYDFTSFAFIDQCLFDLARVAPGAVIVKYADFGLKSQLVGDEGDELMRRNSLNDYDPDKIFIVGASKADNALLTASFEVGGSIISQDRFADAEYEQLWTENTRLFMHSYNEESEQFDFVTREGISLEAWWQDENIFVSGEWLSSDEYADVDFRLRNQVQQANWQWITTPLVHSPEIPVEVYERIEATSKEKRRQARKRFAHRPKRSSGRRQEDSVDVDVSDIELYESLLDSDANELIGEKSRRKGRVNSERSTHKPKKSSGRGKRILVDEDISILEINDPLVEFEFSEPKRSRSIAYLLADDFHGMRKNIGNHITLAGRILTVEDKVSLQWLPGVEAVEIINPPTIDVDLGNSFVQLDGVLEIRDKSIVLRTEDDEMITVVSYAHIREELNAQKRKSRDWSEKEIRHWAIPSFVDSIRSLRSLQLLFAAGTRVNDVDIEESSAWGQLVGADNSGIRSDVAEIAPTESNAQDAEVRDLAVDATQSQIVPRDNEKNNESDATQKIEQPVTRAKEAQAGYEDVTTATSNSNTGESSEKTDSLWSPPTVDTVFESNRTSQIDDTSEVFRKRRLAVAGVLLALLISIVAYLAFTSSSSEESNPGNEVGAHSTAAQWRYFESVVWKK